MALAALIAAYHAPAEPGAPLRAVLPLAGRTLIERQARLAAASGASPIVIVVEKVPAELALAIDRLRRDRLPIVVAHDAAAAAEAIDPNDQVLLVADGFAGESGHFERVAGAGGAAVLTLPDQGRDECYERIDASSRWAGLALTGGALLRETASNLRDWDLHSTLLRRTVQTGARFLPAGEDLAIAQRRSDLAEFQRRILSGAGAPKGGWASRLLAPLERAITAGLAPRAASPQMLGIAAALLTGLGAAALARELLWTGLVLILIASPLDGAAERLARVRMQEKASASWWHALLCAFAGAALIALGYALADEHGWGMILLAVTALAFLLALGVETEESEPPGAVFLAERKGIAWGMLPFAVAGAWAAGLAAVFAYAAGSFFWAQRHAHRDRQD